MDAIEQAAGQIRDNLYQVRNRVHADRIESLRHNVSHALSGTPVTPLSVYLFGSWATGTFDGQSDTDLLVVASDAESADEAEQRLMPLADDVVAMTQAQELTRMNIATRYPLGDAEDPPYELFGKEGADRAIDVASRVVAMAQQVVGQK